MVMTMVGPGSIRAEIIELPQAGRPKVNSPKAGHGAGQESRQGRERLVQTHVVGVLAGEGSGPEVVGAALTVLAAVEAALPGHRFDVRHGGLIGDQAIAQTGQPLSEEVAEFCGQIFKERGAILAGARGNRFVYESRRRFHLNCKLNPLVPPTVPLAAHRMKPETLAGVNILVVRENLGGIYQGTWGESRSATQGAWAEQTFRYTEPQIQKIIHKAAALAHTRRGLLTVVTKPNGVPTISNLWLRCAREIAAAYQIPLRELEIDYAAFALIQDPRQFDVIVTPNLFGDILSDAGGVLLGSRGLCYGGSFSDTGAALYQTNHGAAHDLAGTNRANPVGQIYSLAMMLRESFGLPHAADAIHAAVEQVWRAGYRTADLAEPNCVTLGTHQFASHVAQAVCNRVPA